MGTSEPETLPEAGPTRPEGVLGASEADPRPPLDLGPEPGRGQGRSAEDMAGPRARHQGGGLAPHRWGTLLDRIGVPAGRRGFYDGLLWFVLIGLLGFFGWLAAGLQPADEAAPHRAPSAMDTAIEGVAAETAALQRQLTEAKSRIAALEQALEKERQRSNGARKAKTESPAIGPVIPDLIEGLGGRETEQGFLVTLDDAVLSFPIGRASLPLGDLPALDRIASLLAQHPDLKARIEGHTDSSGREEVNLTLSQERAQAVKQALIERGVSPGRIQAVGYGETRPIADNGTRAGRDRNRRIEIYLVDGPR